MQLLSDGHIVVFLTGSYKYPAFAILQILSKFRYSRAVAKNCKERDNKQGRRFRPSTENVSIL